MGVYIKDFSGDGISDGNGINFMLFRTYGGDLRVRNNETGAVFDAIPVPAHGRLGDLDKLHDAIGKERFSKDALFYAADHEDRINKQAFNDGLLSAKVCVNNAPTIIPAEEERHE